MLKFLLNIIGFFIVFGMGILVMIFGWGLAPVSWGWIIGGGLIGIIIGSLFNAIN